MERDNGAPTPPSGLESREFPFWKAAVVGLLLLCCFPVGLTSVGLDALGYKS